MSGWLSRFRRVQSPRFSSDDIPPNYRARALAEVYECSDCGMTHRPFSVVAGFIAILEHLCSVEACECSEKEKATCRHAFKHAVSNHAWIAIHGESKIKSSKDYWKRKVC